VKFGDTKEGSFALRVSPTLRHEGKVAKGHIANSEGLTDKKAWGQRARWVSYYGPDSSGKDVTITMMDHPSNLNHPTYWHARTYGLLTANPFGEKSFTKKGNGAHVLKKGDSLTQKYALLMQPGTFEKDSVEKTYQTFAK
jgi:subtilisin family serine protease